MSCSLPETSWSLPEKKDLEQRLTFPRNGFDSSELGTGALILWKIRAWHQALDVE